jgi:hypothetical protein
MKVAILGAPRTGKTQLTLALSARLLAQGLAVDIVDAAPLDRLSPHDWVLLCGLDLCEATPEQCQTDAMLRDRLQQAGLNFQVVYGRGAQRLENALFGIGRQTNPVTQRLERPEPPTRWRGPCETCGDGACEHQLFTGLLKP